MSYILDALKKIEHEKNKKRPDGRFNISGDLFRERKQPSSKAGAWKTVTLIVLASLLTCGGTWFAINGRSAGIAKAVRPQAPPQPVPVAPAAATPAPVQLTSPALTLPAASSVVAPVLQKNRAKVGDEEAPVVSRQIIERAKPQPVSVPTVAAPPDIKLSGIAWQDDRSGRRAVINGFLLKEGAVVSGAKISEIQADKVRFSSSAGTFDIKLDAVLPAEVKR
jgi:general secretion pathway protein B